MSNELNDLFPDGLIVGNGIACVSSPIQSTWIWDFYDGPTEGISRLKARDRLIYFKKVWWDESQDNRLFRGVAFYAEELRKSTSKCHEWLMAGLEREAAPAVSADAAREGDNLRQCADEICKLPASIRLHVFCTQITNELFILPVMNK